MQINLDANSYGQLHSFYNSFLCVKREMRKKNSKNHKTTYYIESVHDSYFPAAKIFKTDDFFKRPSLPPQY